jgi:hypothetical protein
LDNRIAYFTDAHSLSPAMAMNIVGMGAKYPVALRDADGEVLTGANTRIRREARVRPIRTSRTNSRRSHADPALCR